MKTLEVLNTNTSIGQFLELARKENILIKGQNGEEFILATVDDFEAEVESLRYNEDFMAFLDARAKEPTIPIEEAKKILL